MSNAISLKETERKVFKSAFLDGLVDITIGCFLLMFAIAPLLSTTLGDFWSSVVFLPFWALVHFVLRVIRKNVVEPRVGIVKYGSWRKTRLFRFNGLMMVFLTFTLVLGILSAVKFDVMPGWIHAARFSLIFLVGFCIAGYFLDFPRLYIYGVLVALAPLIGEVLYVTLKFSHHGFPVTFGTISSLIIVTGLVLFVRMLRDHHLPEQQAEPQGENK